MKSLNRTLSLVLVLAMVFGLFGVASAATFSDNASVQYTEAVGVMTGIGAINGYADGTFKPAGTITREEAAKMVAYAILGPNVASKLSVTATGFKDVDANRWSAPYIAYCVSKGIINGMGDGTFAPTANVTGYQLAKMLLVACGYGKQGEYTGASWELNVAVDANKYGIFSNTKATNYGVAATREEAALYVFNALTKVGQVTWSKVDEQYKPVAETNAAYDDDTLYTIGEAVYGLKKAAKTVNGVDGYTWVNADAKDMSSFISSQTVLATITDGTTVGTVSSTASTKYVADLGDTVEYYFNGTKVTATSEGSDGEPFVNNNKLYVSNGGGTADVEYSVKGAIVTLYAGTGDNAKKIAKVGIIEKTIDVIDSNAVVVTPVLNSDSTVKVDLKNNSDITGTVKTVVGYEGLAKGDVVLYYSMGGKTYIEKAASFNGSVTAIAGTKYTIGGKDYEVAGLKTFEGALPTLTDVGQTYYTDSFGYLVAKLGPTAPVADKYALVLGYKYTAADVLTGTAESSKAQLLLADGTKGVFDLVTDAGKVKNDNLTVGSMIKYVMASDNKTITTATQVSATNIEDNLTVTNKASTVSIDLVGKDAATYYMTSSTVFFFYEDPNNYGVVIGSANVPTTNVSKDASNKAVAFEASATNVLKAILLPAKMDTVTGTENYAYVTSSTPTQTLVTVNGISKVLYTYKAIVNGAVSSISTLDSTSVSVGIHTYATDSTGYCKISDVTLAQGDKSVTVADSTFFVCNNAVYNITTKTVLYKASFAADKTINGLTAAPIELSASKTTKAWVVADGSNNALYVIWYQE